jgi:hypothetical protein
MVKVMIMGASRFLREGFEREEKFGTVPSTTRPVWKKREEVSLV